MVKPWLALASVMALGLAVRLYGLTAYGVWFDEAYHIQLVQLPDIPTMLDAVLSNPPSDPLYVLLLRGWTTIFGYGDLSVRMLSVILGTFTIPATCWLGCVMANRSVGLVGALLLAVSPYAIEFSQEAAMYALASLTTTLAIAAGWRWRKSGSGLTLYVILATIAIYSHYVVAIILVLFMLLGLYKNIPGAISMRSWLAANSAVFLLWSPWLIALVTYWIASPQPRASLPHPATMEDVRAALVQFTGGTAALQQGQAQLQMLALFSGTALLLVGLLVSWKTRSFGFLIIVTVSTLFFLLPAVVSAMTGWWLFVPHFMLFLLPALLAVLACGITWQPAGTSFPVKPGNFLPLLLIPMIAVQIWGLGLFYRHPPHGADGLRELASVLKSEARANEPVFVTPPVLTPTLRQYYSGRIHGLPVDFDLKSVYLPYEASRWYEQSVAALDADSANLDRFWLVYRPETDEGLKLLDYMTSHYDVVSRHKYIYADLYLLESP